MTSRRTVVYAPWVSAFLFPAGAPAPAAFLLPGCPPRFRGGFCASRTACHLSALFHLRTCAAVVPTLSATCRAVMVPPESSHTRRALSRAGLLSRAMRPRPLSFVFHFPPRVPRRKRIKNGPCSKHGPFFIMRAAWRIPPPASLCSLFTIPIIADKSGNGWQSYFCGKLNRETALFCEKSLASRFKASFRIFRHCRGL